MRGRNWATVLYPDSMPEDCFGMIDDFHLPCFVSPLHDSDVDKFGNLQKVHYHVMFMFDSPVTDKQFKDRIVEQLHGVGTEFVHSRRSYARYLCHMDTPNKHTYNPDDVLQFGGINYYDIITQTSDNMQSLTEIIQFVNEQHITSYSSLVDYSVISKKEWFSILMSYQGRYIKDYILSKVSHFEKLNGKLVSQDVWHYLPGEYNIFDSGGEGGSAP